MVQYNTLKVVTGETKDSIIFGEANMASELTEIYRLRYEIYSLKGYIDRQKYSNRLEMDDYDKKGLCKYFIAKIDEKLIGAIRLILTDPLPTETSFKFQEPLELSLIPRSKRAELGRFIIIPPDARKSKYIPRGLVMLFLLDTLSSYGMKNDILGGYAFVKQSLSKKMDKFGMPYKPIDNYELVYPKHGDLYLYFSQEKDPVSPVYFLTQDFFDYSNKKIRKSSMFKRDSENEYTLQNSLYMNFLRYLKVI